MSFIADFIFPANCLICRRLGTYICPQCVRSLTRTYRDICPCCGKGSNFGLSHRSCQNKYKVDGLKSFYYYDAKFKKLLSGIKYRLAQKALLEFMQWFVLSRQSELYEYFSVIGQIDYIIYVPLSLTRKKKRGFNQSAVVAGFVGQILKKPIIKDYLLKTKETDPQATIKDYKKRQENIRGVFRINLKVAINPRAKFLLIDDVWTSGSTAWEITKLLKKEAKAERVFVFTLARSRN